MCACVHVWMQFYDGKAKAMQAAFWFEKKLADDWNIMIFSFNPLAFPLPYVVHMLLDT